MSHNPVGWFEIYVQDLPRAKAFYEAVLATRLTQLDIPQGELWAFPMHKEAKGASGALVKMEGMPSGKNSVLVYFSCEDCATESARVEPSGGRVFQPKFSIGPYGFISLVIDTEGNMVGLHSLR